MVYKRSEKKQKKAKIREKERKFEKISQLGELKPKITTNVMGHAKNRPPLKTRSGSCFKSNRTTQKFGQHTRVPVKIGKNQSDANCLCM
jgi:hypothetical protein